MSSGKHTANTFTNTLSSEQGKCHKPESREKKHQKSTHEAAANGQSFTACDLPHIKRRPSTPTQSKQTLFIHPVPSLG